MCCWQITAPHFVAGFVMYNGAVEQVAPIIRYMKGWDITSVEEYCKKKNWLLFNTEVGYGVNQFQN